MNFNNFPNVRMRRNRMKSFSRDLIREHQLSVNDLIYPIFVTYGSNKKEPIKEMPNIYRFSLDMFEQELKKIIKLKIPAIAIFPNIENNKKDALGTEALNENNLICNAIKIARNVSLDLGIICDVALDPYTDHGHDGVITNSEIDNDKSLKILAKQAIIQAKAGCDIIAPSDMMDGRVGIIRNSLEQEKLTNIQIMSYTAKYSSSFYGPFRSAINSNSLQIEKNKDTYQMDFSNSHEAIREAELDISEGADMLMVKPGLPYLDIIHKLKTSFNIPVFAYQVSGEYSMLMNAINNNLLSEKTIIETLTSFKRAGCNGILTYFAPIAVKLIQEKY